MGSRCFPAMVFCLLIGACTGEIAGSSSPPMASPDAGSQRDGGEGGAVATPADVAIDNQDLAIGGVIASLEGIYVGPNGDDANAGTSAAPLRTFAEALNRWVPGTEIRALSGVYSEQLSIASSGTQSFPLRVVADIGASPILDRQGAPGGKNILLTGDWILVSGFEVRNSGNQCVDADGRHLVVSNLVVHDCDSHGVMVTGQDVTVRDSLIYHTVLENQGGYTSSGWGSALKVAVGGDGVLLERNRVVHNWGEGIALTRAKNVTVRQNWSHDNFSVNIYVDNSLSSTVDGNLVTCTGTSGYERNGSPPVGIATAEEYYDGWGAQLADLTISNNIVAFCKNGFVYWGADVPGGGLSNVQVVHNTLWGSTATALSIASEPAKTAGSEIADNLIQQPEHKLAWVEDATGIALHNNFWVGSAPAADTSANGPGDRAGNPGLAFAPGLTAKSFRLASSSACRDGAQAAASVPRDFEGRARVTQNSPGADMGAMEYGDPNAPSTFDALWQNELGWAPLYGDHSALAELFDHPSDWSGYQSVWLWVRRIGDPDPISVSLKMNSRGVPGPTYATQTLNASALAEGQVRWLEFDLSGGAPLIGASSYLVVAGSHLHDWANHWEVGVAVDRGTSISYFTHTIWNRSDYGIEYEMTP